MDFTPDIVVTVPDSLGMSLVAGTKIDNGIFDEAEHALKNYMLQTDCPVGLIVTLSRLRIYKNQFLSRSEDSIELVADFPTRELFGLGHLKTRSLLESELLHWLERMAETSEASVPNSGLNKAISKYVLPAVSGGLVSFAHPNAV